MKIQAKLISGFFMISLSVAAVGIFAVSISQEALKESIGVHSEMLAQEILSGIDRSIYDHIEEIEAYSKDLVLQDTLNNSNSEFEKLDNIQGYISENDRQWALAAEKEITPFMFELINNELARELKEKIEFYEDKYTFAVYGEIFATNKFGANAGQTGKTSDYRQDDEDWWKVARENGLYVGNVQYDESAGIYSTDIGVRVEDEDGEFIGIIKAVLNFEDIIGILKKTQAEENTMNESMGNDNMHSVSHDIMSYKLITAEGKLIYSEEEYEIMQDTIEYFPLISDGILKSVHYFSVKENISKSEKEKFVAFAHSGGYKEFKGFGWILAVEHNSDEIFASLMLMRKNILIVSIILLALALFSGTYISRSISRPLGKLKGLAERISAGNYDTAINIKSKDEIGALARSFTKMGEEIKKSHKQINDQNEALKIKVKERTAELEDKVSEMEKMNKLTIGREIKMIGLKKRISELEGELNKG